MPFLSSKQERFMWANHPDIARRWASEYGSYEHPTSLSKAKLRSPKGVMHSEESASPQIHSLPKKGGFQRDFAKLKPSSSERFKPRNKPTPNLHEADKESPPTYVTNSRHRELGKPTKPTGLSARDYAAAALNKGGNPMSGI